MLRFMPWISLCKKCLLVTVGSELYCYPTDKKGIPVCETWHWKIDVPKVPRYNIRTNDISRFKVKGNHIVCGNRYV